MKRLALCIAAMILFVSLTRAADPATQPAVPSIGMDDQSIRRPYAAVPISGGITVDGAINKGEWAAYAKLHDFVSVMDQSEDNGACAPEQTETFVTYNEAGLYVGFKMWMDPGNLPATSVTTGRDVGMNDDAFEFFLIPPDSPAVYHFGGTAAGVLWDRTIQGAHPDWTWNASGAKYAVKVDAGNNWWVGEWFIPWKDIGGRSMPKDGEAWSVNFCANRRTPSFRLDTWSYWRKWTDYDNNGKLIFGGKSAAIVFGDRFGGLTKDAYGGDGCRPRVYTHHHTVDKPITIDYRLEMWRKASPTGPSFFYDLQKRRDQSATEGGTFASFDKDVADALKDYVPNYRLGKPQPLPDPQFTGAWGDSIKVNEPGDYLLVYKFTDITDSANPKPVAGGAVPFRVRVGVQATCWPYLLTRKSVVLKGDVRAVKDLDKVKKIRGIVVPRGGGDVIAENTIDFTGEKRFDLEIPNAAAAPPGNEYEARLQALDESGAVMTEAITTFQRPAEPDWWVNRAKYGAEPEVPKPWTPVEWKADTKTASVWGREITYGDSGLPIKIITRQQDLLAAPIDFELRSEGQLQNWTSAKLEVKEQRPGHILLESTREAAGVRITTRTRLEFDGFSLVDLTIETIGDVAKVESLDLVMPVKTEHAQFLTNYRNAPGPGPSTPRFCNKTPEHYESPVMLTTWLGTDNYGLEWSCESSRDWYISKPKRAIEVDRKSDTTTARFHFIDAPMTIARARNIKFGLVATPVKPVNPEWLNMRIDGLSYWPQVAGVGKTKQGTVTTEEDVKNWFRQYGMVDVSAMLLPGEWSGVYIWHAHVTDPAQAAEMKHRVGQLNKHEMKGLWNGGWGVAPYAKEYDPWGKEMVAHPITPTFANQLNGTYASPLVEFMIGSWTLNVRDLGLHGIRFDTVIPWSPSENPYLGEAWSSDVPGQEKAVYGTQSLWRQREMMKRMYRTFVNQGSPGIFWMGIAGPPIMAAESFETIREIGEGPYMNAASIKEAYPQDAIRPWMTRTAYGFIEVNSIKGKPLKSINRVGPLMVADASPRMSGRDHMNESTYEPKSPEAVPTHRIWDSWSWIDRSTAKFHPHWENKEILSTSVEGNTGEHYASFHLQPGRRVLLVVANYEKTPLKVKVQLQRDRLGFSPDVKLEATDAVLRQPVAVENDSVTLEIGPELFRLIKLGPADELSGKNLDPLHPDTLP